MLQSSNLSLMSPDGVIGQFAALADGFYANGEFPALIDPDPDGKHDQTTNVLTLGLANGWRDRSVLVDTMYTTGNDNDAFDVHVHAVDILGAGIGQYPRLGIRTRKIGSLAVVAAAGVPRDGTFVPDTAGGGNVRVIDTIASWTPTDYGTALLTAAGGPLDANDTNAAMPVILSPEDDTNGASVWFPDLGAVWGVFFEPAGPGRLLRGFVRRYT